MRGLTTCVLSLLSNKICSCRLTHFYSSYLPWYVGGEGAERRLAAFVLSRIDVNVFWFWFCFYCSVLSLSLYVRVSFKLSSYKVVMVVAFSLFFCLQVAADQFCFMLPLPSPFSLSLSFVYVLFFFAGDAKTKIPIASSWPRMIVCLCSLSLSVSPLFSLFRSQVYLLDVPLCMCARIRMNREEEGSLFAHSHARWWWKHLTNFFTQFSSSSCSSSSSSFACCVRSNASHHFLFLFFFSFYTYIHIRKIQFD